MPSKRPARPVAKGGDEPPIANPSGPSSSTRAAEPRPSHARRLRAQAQLNPRFTFLLYVAVAVGTIPIEAVLRNTILWSVLALLVLAHVASQALAMRFAYAPVLHGILIGLLITLPLGYVARAVLLTLAATALGTSSGLLLFQRMVFIAAPLEELYYRGCVQRDYGVIEATLFYAVAALLLYWPATQGFWLVLATMVTGSALLGVIFALVNKRYGLSAAIACHTVSNLCLFVVPSLLRDWGSWLNI